EPKPVVSVILIDLATGEIPGKSISFSDDRSLVEIVVVSCRSDAIKKGLPNVKIVESSAASRFARMNTGACAASGALVCFLRADSRAASDDWLSVIAAEALMQSVGAVSPIVVYPDRTIKHAGFVLGRDGRVASMFRKARSSARG